MNYQAPGALLSAGVRAAGGSLFEPESRREQVRHSPLETRYRVFQSRTRTCINYMGVAKIRIR